MTDDTLADVAHKRTPVVEFWQLLRSSPDVADSRMNIGDSIDLIRPASACIGVRYSNVWPAWLTARPTAASSSGRLVSASLLACGLAARTYQLHQL